MNKQRNYSAKVEGYTKIVDSGNSDLKYIELGRLFLEKEGTVYKSSTTDREIGINILSGIFKLTVKTAAGKVYSFEKAGNRMNPFQGSPALIYVPINCEYTLEVLKGPFDAAVYSSPSSLECEPRVISPEEVENKKTGKLNWSRLVRQGIGDNVEAHRLLLGETLNPSGNWSGYPPHKHDEYNPPNEKPSEEIYWFHFDRPEGFAFIRLYTNENAAEPFDEVYLIKEGDIITIKRGYHCMAVAPGYKMQVPFSQVHFLTYRQMLLLR
jgi:5-deoxy-glucuronate isomerase